ncbi:MAG: HAD-IIIC family phosphatase [Bryobacterales bacterium]|nr:HAD-IIIC family phosphatase [Bryobacterales bacterium]
MLAVSATFTAELIEDTLRFWMRELGLDFEIRFAPYNQVFQQLLDPGSLLLGNRSGVNLVLARLEDWAQSGPEALESNVRHFISCLHSAAAAVAAPLVVCLCPDSPRFLSGREETIERLHQSVCTAAAELNSVYVLTAGAILRSYPVSGYYDPHGDELGHVPYTPAFFAALGTAAARRIRSLRVTPYKVVVLDCDETLWSGICGEDGPEGIRIDPPRRALQEFMLAQHDAGMLLCLCSKNNEEDVLETFRLNPDMPLRLEHFASRRINWEPKSSNLVVLAEELGLGLESFILVDDNPKECAEVQANRPEVLTLQLPSDPSGIPGFLEHVWAFDHLKTTAEDSRRTLLYSQRAERHRLEKQAVSLEAFLEALDLKIEIAPVRREQIARVSQLTQRTNQMNFTAVRRTEGQIQALLRAGAECLTVEVKDRFGSYGLVGVMIFESSPEALTLDTFLLSCRALGRGVEHRMLARLGELAPERGAGWVLVRFRPAARNRPALDLLRSVGRDFEQPDGESLLFRFPAAYLAGVRYKPNERPSKPSFEKPLETVANNGRPETDFARIARELSRPERILEHVRAGRQASSAAANSDAAPRTGLERELTALWSRLLHVPSLGVHDNFFDLGGHSLLAVQLISEVRRKFNVDLSLQIIYGGAFTVAELAKAIELFQIEQAGAGGYDDLLAELEGLSDEEVKALLAREQGAG